MHEQIVRYEGNLRYEENGVQGTPYKAEVTVVDVPGAVVKDIRYAFPRGLVDEVRQVVAALPTEGLQLSYGFVVSVADQVVEIPYRVYGPEPRNTCVDAFSPREALILHCLYSRHHDGFVRQRHLYPLLEVQKEWVVPFVLHLLGEYVLEIIRVLQENIRALRSAAYVKFAEQNPEFVRRTKSRIVSYWNCYHRPEVPHFCEYPGFLVAEELGWWREWDIPRLRAR